MAPATKPVRTCATLICATVVLVAAGCSTYTTPGAGVNVTNLSGAPPDIASMFKVVPASPFPARLAVARVQASGYYSRSNTCYGSGQFCVVATRDIEPEATYDRLSSLPLVAGVAPLNRILLPDRLSSTADLRQAAARLKADILLVYSLQTSFNIESTDIGPLALISLGFLPNKKAHVTASASAAIFDVRTGFIYGTAESSASEEQRASVWSSSAAIDDARVRAESAAFQKLMDEIPKVWNDVLKTNAACSPSV